MKKEAEPLGIIIATHGKLGQELIRSAKMIFGEFDRVTPVALSLIHIFIYADCRGDGSRKIYVCKAFV